MELESIKEPGRYVGIISNGQLKSALATGRENDADFTPKLIVSFVCCMSETKSLHNISCTVSGLVVLQYV